MSALGFIRLLLVAHREYSEIPIGKQQVTVACVAVYLARYGVLHRLPIKSFVEADRAIDSADAREAKVAEKLVEDVPSQFEVFVDLDVDQRGADE
jgi:hypothetical protein